MSLFKFPFQLPSLEVAERVADILDKSQDNYKQIAIWESEIFIRKNLKLDTSQSSKQVRARESLIANLKPLCQSYLTRDDESLFGYKGDFEQALRDLNSDDNCVQLNGLVTFLQSRINVGLKQDEKYIEKCVEANEKLVNRLVKAHEFSKSFSLFQIGLDLTVQKYIQNVLGKFMEFRKVMTTDESERLKIQMLASKIKQLSLVLVHEVRTKFDHPEISQELCQKKIDKFIEQITRNIEELNKIIKSPTRKSEIDGGKSIIWITENLAKTSLSSKPLAGDRNSQSSDVMEVNDVVNKADRNQSPVLDDILNFLSNEKDQQISSALKTENLRKFLQQLQGLRDAMRKENSGQDFSMNDHGIDQRTRSHHETNELPAVGNQKEMSRNSKYVCNIEVNDQGDKCGIRFTRIDALTRHIKNIHKGETSAYCEICGVKLGRDDNRKKHQQKCGLLSRRESPRNIRSIKIKNNTTATKKNSRKKRKESKT